MKRINYLLLISLIVVNMGLPVSVKAIENETLSIDFSDNQNPIVDSDSAPILSSTEILTTPSTNSSESGKQLEVFSSEESIETKQTTDTGTIQSETTSSTVNEESVSKEINTNSEKAVDWETEDKGTYILLKRYTGSATDLVVPNEINGKPTKLLDIDENVILNMSNLESFIVQPNQKGQKVGLESTDLSEAFMSISGHKKRLKTINLSGLDTSNVTNMEFMFAASDTLTNVDLGDSFDTSNVTKMNNMFNLSIALTSLNLGDKFDTSNVTNMEVMFGGCSSLKELDLGNNFNTSNVTNMHAMFDLCSSLTSLNLGGKFDTSNVTNMKFMFSGCMSLKKLDLGNKFDTSQVTSMLEMFNLCTSLMSLNLGDKFNTSNVIKMDRMFANCMSLKKIDLGEKFNVNKKKVSNLFSVPYSTPLLVITKDSQLLNSYDYSTDNRVPVSKPYLDANGGLFEDSQPTKNYFTKVANTPEYCSLEKVQDFLNINKPTKENYRFKQWKVSPKDPTNLEELLNTTYTATWQDDSIIDSNIPSQDQDNVVTRPLTAYGIAYVPKQFTFASTSLKDNGEQIIPFTKMESFHIGIRDVRNTESSWTVSAQLEWTGQTLPGTEIVTTNATGIVKKNNNNGVDDFDANKDFTECPTSEVIGQRNVIIQSTSPTPILMAPSGTHNAVYDYDLGNVALRIPETRQIEPTAYHGNVQWFLNNTL